MNRFESNYRTHPGAVRETNEDSLLSRPEQGLWVVADGMGGYEAGDIASQMIVQALSDINLEGSLAHVVNLTEDVLLDVNRRIQRHSDVLLDGRIFGSTVVTLLIRGHLGIGIWAGDSRLYRYRDGQLQRLTRDHSQLQEMLDSGLILETEVADYPDSNIITRAVGAEHELMLDMVSFDVQQDDTFLLCSDGLYNTLDEDIIRRILKDDDAASNVEELMGCALEKNARDNVSLVIVKNRDIH